MKKRKMLSFYVLVFLIFFLTTTIYEANAHSLFNSAESTIGDYRVQIATLPEIPSTGEKSQILLRVTDRDLNEVDRFTSGIRIFFNGEEVDTIPPQAHDGGHWQTDYVFQSSGNHIFRVDLYDVAKDGGVITYTFNISTQNPFGYIFIYSIAAGSIGFVIILSYIYLPKILKSRTKS
ncbi:MAG: hypothetical protein ACT4OW_04875 [Nitrososphaerota archaeon]